MGTQGSPVNDPGTVRREYENEERFLTRRLTTWATLSGPQVEDATVAAVAEGAPDRVLEVGCGTGDFTERVQRELGVDLVAMDLSPRMVELTRGRGIDARVGDIEAIPFADESFDCVLANRVLYHVPDLDRGVAEIARVLRPGGRLVAVTYSERHLGELSDLLGDVIIASTFSAETGAALLRAHFALVERRDVTGRARFPSTDSLVGFAAQRFGDFSETDLDARLRTVAMPFEATYRHALFVAHRR